jgi:hypothetical protein
MSNKFDDELGGKRNAATHAGAAFKAKPDKA